MATPTTVSKKRISEMTAEEAMERIERRRRSHREYLRRLREKANSVHDGGSKEVSK